MWKELTEAQWPWLAGKSDISCSGRAAAIVENLENTFAFGSTGTTRPASFLRQTSSKKMKHFFKRYLEYEKGTGDVDRVEHVKDKARVYIEAKIAA